MVTQSALKNNLQSHWSVEFLQEQNWPKAQNVASLVNCKPLSSNHR